MAAQKKHKSGNDSLEGELQLIAMRKHDSSWHPCKISLCSGRVGLNVEYMKNGSNDVILTKEEALAQLRICPTPLEGEECTLIGQGEHVLANPKSQAKDIFFEAEVEKRVTVKHSKKRCTCSFVVRWNCYGSEGETAVLPFSAIMKMSATCIEVHPTIAAFFNILAIPGCNFSPLSTLVEGTKNCEMDVFELETEGSDCEMDAFKLERQIEDISNSAAASEMETSKKLVFGIQINEHKRQAQYISTTAHSPFVNQMKEKELKSSLTPPIMKEEPVKIRTSVNPQAAVAYFALQKSKFSGSTECSSTLKGAKLLKPQPGFGEISKDGTPYNLSFVGNYTNGDDYSTRTEAAIPKYVLKDANIVKKLFSIKEATKDHRILDESCDASYWKESENPKFQPEIVDDISNTASSATNDKVKKPSCSARQRSSGNSRENVEMTCITDTKSMPSSIKARRLTRSVIREAEANKINKKKPSSVQDRDLLEEEETVVSISDAETASTSLKKMKCQGSNGEFCDEKDSEKRTRFVGIKASNNMRRSPRSAGRRLTENNDMEHYKRFEASRSSDFLKGNVSSESKASEKEDSIKLALCPPRTAGRSNKVQTSPPVKTLQTTTGDAPTNHGCGKRVKEKSFSHKKQQPRKSPRLLGFLPRTRSQDKS